MRASRLLSMQMLLQARGRISAQALAAALAVSVRTLYRDIEQLTEVRPCALRVASFQEFERVLFKGKATVQATPAGIKALRELSAAKPDRDPDRDDRAGVHAAAAVGA